MNAVAIELKLPVQQYEYLTTVARARHQPVAEIVQTAVAEWLNSQTQLDRARALMRELGDGLAQSSPPHDTARNHDTYLYSREQGRHVFGTPYN